MYPWVSDAKTGGTGFSVSIIKTSRLSVYIAENGTVVFETSADGGVDRPIKFDTGSAPIEFTGGGLITATGIIQAGSGVFASKDATDSVFLHTASGVGLEINDPNGVLFLDQGDILSRPGLNLNFLEGSTSKGIHVSAAEGGKLLVDNGIKPGLSTDLELTNWSTNGGIAIKNANGELVLNTNDSTYGIISTDKPSMALRQNDFGKQVVINFNGDLIMEEDSTFFCDIHYSTAVGNDVSILASGVSKGIRIDGTTGDTYVQEKLDVTKEVSANLGVTLVPGLLPAVMAAGTLWFNSADLKVYVSTGVIWIPIH